MKRLFIIIFLLLLVGVGCNETKLGGDLDTSVTIKSDIDILQADWIKTHNNYKQVLKEDTNGEYSVTEYKTSKGEVGYQVLFYDKNGRLTTSTGYGVEADSRTWIKEYPIIINSST